ncbi:unnamed protein product [Discula destructiva]
MLSQCLTIALAILTAGTSCGAAAQTKSYDFIIVGGGTAGAAVATRLSQRLTDSRVLLIEAGPAAGNVDSISIPALRGTTVNTVYDWNLTSVPQAALNNKTWSLPRGRVLGGSSALNYMAWTKASAAEYDAWEELGNPGWNWSTMRECMMRAETFTPSAVTDDFVYVPADDGRSGPIQTVIDRLTPKFEPFWFPTLANLGISKNSNPAGGDLSGASLNPTSIDSGNYVRSYSANAYIPQAGPNLEVMLETRVAKLIFEPHSDGSGLQRASGATLTDGTFIEAKSEVILSAGSFQSAGLLEISGIGQNSVLETAGIQQLIELPGVGENLQDHIDFFLSYELKPEFSPGFDTLAVNATYAAAQLDLYRNGDPSQYDQSDKVYAFLNWKQVAGNDSLLVGLAGEVLEERGNDTTAIDRIKLGYLTDDTIPQFEAELIDGYLGGKGYPSAESPLYGRTFLTIFIEIMHTLSRGNVHIASADITDPPAIDGNWLSNEYDIQASIASLKFARTIAQTEPLASAWVAEYEPGLDVTTDEQWRQFVKDTAGSTDHPLGSCAMLPREDGGVVDPRLVVYGTSNVRVVDASIIPVQPSAHIQTAVYGIAEMAADFIVGDWNSSFVH